MRKLDEQKIRKSIVQICDNLELSDKLLSYLYQEKVLTRGKFEEYGELRRIKQRRDAVRDFISHIIRCDSKAFNVFLDGLIESEQDHLAEIISPGYVRSAKKKKKLTGQYDGGPPAKKSFTSPQAIQQNIRDTMNLLKNPRTTRLQFYQALLSVDKNIPLTMVVDESGNNVLHLVIEYDRPSFLEVFVWTKYFNSLLETKGNSDGDLTPLELAQSRRSSLVLQQLLSMVQVEKNMPDVCKLARDPQFEESNLVPKTVEELECRYPPNGQTAIQYAIIADNSRYIKYCVEQYGLRIDADELSTIAAFGRVSTLELLIKKGLHKRIHLSVEKKAELINGAVQNATLDMIQMLMKKFQCPFEPGPILMLAIERNVDVKFIKLLQAEDLLPISTFNCSDPKTGLTPLMASVIASRLDCVIHMVTCGASLDAVDKNNENVFHKLVYIPCSNDIERKLVQNITEFLIDEVHKREGKTFRKDGRAQKLKILGIQNLCASIETVRSRLQKLKLHCSNNHASGKNQGRSLRDVDMDTSESRDDGSIVRAASANQLTGVADNTPLLHAIIHHNAYLASLLVPYTPDVSMGDSTGRTPLHLATQAGHLELVKLLVAREASLKKCTIDGHTPLDTARIYQQKTIYNYLKSTLVIEKTQSKVKSLYQFRDRTTGEAVGNLLYNGGDLRRMLISQGRELYSDLEDLIAMLTDDVSSDAGFVGAVGGAGRGVMGSASGGGVGVAEKRKHEDQPASTSHASGGGVGKGRVTKHMALCGSGSPCQGWIEGSREEGVGAMSLN